jgi:ABC-type iron transport system FetAB ATPase subunit
MARLRLEDFGPELLSPCNLGADTGETVTLTGPSGSGKTLLLRALADLDPHRGIAWLNDRPATDFAAPDWRRRVCYLPAESHWWSDRVRDHFPLVDDATLSALGLPGEIPGWAVSRLSSGERQRLAVARLLSVQPEVLLLDEPTANLDPANTERVERVVADYRDRHAATVLWVSHDADQRKRLGHRHWLIRDGRVEETA